MSSSFSTLFEKKENISVPHGCNNRFQSLLTTGLVMNEDKVLTIYDSKTSTAKDRKKNGILFCTPKTLFAILTAMPCSKYTSYDILPKKDKTGFPIFTKLITK